MQKEISVKILTIMKQKHLSYSDLARLTAISKSTLQRYIANEGSKVPIDRLEKIANALGVKASYLLGWREETSKSKHIRNDMSLGEFASEFDTTIDRLNNAFEVFERWQSEVGEFDFDADELQELIDYAKFIKMRRTMRNG